MNNQQIEQRRTAAAARGVGVMCDFYAERAENATIWDVEGRVFTDFAAGIAVLNTGHRHPKVISAIQAQLERFTHTCYQVVPYESVVDLMEKINAMAPIAGPAKTAFFTTGAEAVENAIKVARAHTRRSGVIAFGGAFHGRTMMGMALTGKVAPYKIGFGPFPGEVYHLPFPQPLHGITVQDSLDALTQLFKCDIEASRVAAIIIEPVQGEGGFNVAPAELMVKLREICDAHGILLIADEVQTGFGRTGKLFAMEHHTVKPDLVTMAKSLAGGMPLSALCGRAEVMDSAAPGGLGGTYAANPLAVAASLAVIEAIREENLLQRSVDLGAQLQEFLGELRERCPAIADVRGLGSMVAAEFNDAQGKPDAAVVGRIQKEALARGLILLSCGVYGNVIRFLYPLTIPQQQFDDALAVLAESIDAAVGATVAA
ncbi:4-aminobutyrate--2-oxoglutarate transaminase [Xylophilus sp. GOD-11R]|uniref:4-aminobutyrate--2-oxoglutarate transaminase n=1 Tax=Xylophilus sp. GOD-11R TaxID=3089814 RepID=UPI00298C5444|nr:4-aminobutyrate--2-oxoglutarate transaminase [Xylophilus sp. GOD-11R]WPB57030.1 4-aminobutyrate--2-oxoglutarate transaminase [Xylophilus sp. GOD-11R]